MKRIVLACGGTGGHFYPGYALACALRTRGWEPLFILRKEDPAIPTLEADGFPYVELDLRGLSRTPGLGWAFFGFKLLSSLRIARNIMRSFDPRCVVGMGGYLTFPIVAAARWKRIPSLIHESNAVLGLANRACLPFASKVALGLPISGIAHGPGKRYELAGTPVRTELQNLPAPQEARRALGLDPALRTILIFGGSQGARSINRAAPEAAGALGARRPDWQILHLSGTGEEEAVKEAYKKTAIRAVVKPTLRGMHQAYAAADLVVCRAGASTLAELCATRRPAILVPYPAAAADHQEANALILARAGAARLILDKDLSAPALANELEDLIFSPQVLEKMAGRYESLGLPAPAEALSALVRAVESLGSSRRP
ncbi:MAG: undecaprenyldiphospho-muramoylpentapeptide beta-N-acetylglucosaminyltransferase [Elusimicrobia bacterium]|nr:undecaprenyldiphospho-muramoylpentapeptide beta-N-acetylglucosaminyltransferase [Elusimicrobiota bacterium]